MQKKYIVLSIVVIVIGLWVGYRFFFYKKTTAMTRSVAIPVQTGSINEVVKTTGKIYPLQNSVLSFTKQGNIKQLYKKAGDEVKAGDVLAEIDAGSANLDIKNAELSLSNAQNNYNKVAWEGKNTDIIRAENTLTDSQAKLTLLEKNRDDLIFSQENAEKNAEENIKMFENKVTVAENDYSYEEQSQNTDTDTNNIERDVTNAFLAAQDTDRIIATINSDLKKILMIDEKNTSAYGDFWANNPTIKAQMEQSYTHAVDDFAEFEKQIQSMQTADVRTFDSVMSITQYASTVLTEYDTLMALAIQTVDGSAETASLPGSMHDSMKSSLRSYASQIENKLSSINNSVTALKNYGTDDLQSLQKKNTLLQKKNSLTQAQNDLEKGRTSLAELQRSNDSALLQANQNIDSQKNTIKLNDSSLKDLKSPSNTDLVSAENSVKSAKINLEKLQLGLQDYQIIAPFDGKILDIPWSTGSTTLSTEGITLSNDNTYEVRVLLDQADIVKIKPWMNARVTLDAFPDTTIPWVISSVSGAPTETSNVVSYSAKILLSKVDTPIFSDMTATVEIITVEKNNIILIPSTALHTREDKSFVTVRWSDGKDENREVTIGTTSGNQTEIVSWLNLGETIILTTEIAWNRASWNKTNSSFSIPGLSPTGWMGGNRMIQEWGWGNFRGGGTFNRSGG